MPRGSSSSPGLRCEVIGSSWQGADAVRAGPRHCRPVLPERRKRAAWCVRVVQHDVGGRRRRAELRGVVRQRGREEVSRLAPIVADAQTPPARIFYKVWKVFWQFAKNEEGR